MKIKIWKHHGAISVTNIKKKTGCDKVLMKAIARKNVAGTSLVAWKRDADPGYYKAYPLTIAPMWQFMWFFNNEFTEVTPLSFLELLVKKSSYYRICQYHQDVTVWTEARSKYYKIGEHNTDNEFVLIYNKD